MKKIVIVLFIIIFIASVALNVITVVDLNEGGELLIMDKPLSYWKEFAEAELLPKVILAISSLATAYTMFIPLVNRVKAELEKFKGATDDINATTVASLKSNKQVSEFKAEMEQRFDEYEKYMKQRLDEYGEYMGQMKKATEENASILRMGLCNIPDLVRNGTARQIAKIGEGEKEQIYEETEI